MGKETTGRRTALLRAIAVLALAGIVGGLLAAGPAGAAKFLTKKKGNKLFLTNAEGETLFIEDRIIYRRGTTIEIADGDDEFVVANCPAGTLAIGGGAYTENQGMWVETSTPGNGTDDLLGFTSWVTWVENQSGTAGEVSPYAVCLNAATVDANFLAGEDPRDPFTV